MAGGAPPAETDHGMSRPNKVNKSNYDQGGRLTPDEIARERMRQARVPAPTKRDQGTAGKAPAALAGKASRRPRTPR